MESEIEYLPLDEAVSQYGIPKTTMWRLFKQGKVEGRKDRGRIILRRSSLDALRSSDGTPHSMELEQGVPSGETPPDEVERAVPAEQTELAVRAPDRSGENALSQLLTLRLDALHQQLRQAERDNETLRSELDGHTRALEEKTRSLAEREASVREAEARQAEHNVALRAELETTRRQLAALDEEKRLALGRAELAERLLQQGTHELTRAREQLLLEQNKSWWQKLMEH